MGQNAQVSPYSKISVWEGLSLYPTLEATGLYYWSQHSSFTKPSLP